MAARDLRTRLQKRAIRAGVFLSADVAEKLAAYYELLARWNLKINLTAISDIDEAIDRLLAGASRLPSGTSRPLGSFSTSAQEVDRRRFHFISPHPSLR